MVVVVQLVRTPDCGSGGRRFESGLPPKSKPSEYRGFFCCSNYWMSSDIINYNIDFLWVRNPFRCYFNKKRRVYKMTYSSIQIE
jgi:hypothetical protein